MKVAAPCESWWQAPPIGSLPIKSQSVDTGYSSGTADTRHARVESFQAGPWTSLWRRRRGETSRSLVGRTWSSCVRAMSLLIVRSSYYASLKKREPLWAAPSHPKVKCPVICFHSRLIDHGFAECYRSPLEGRDTCGVRQAPNGYPHRTQRGIC